MEMKLRIQKKNIEIKENEQLTFWKQNMPSTLVPDSVTNENKNKKMKFPDKQT